MKALIKAVLIACTLSAPVFAFAQATNAPLTRAQVRADLIRVEQAGYHPDASDPNYPDDIQAAEAKIAAQGQAAEMNAVGGVPMASASQAGSPVALSDTQSLFAHP
ncbi:DUF4148 domain-containing protein [Trinickia dinghuensis]|uniref:DUF4148 domain-containing protein n=1 Tax=Trinickia dinghuensis TaxID=2291023 RepID=A0A3D8JYS5_9BURK|nr:DUF4148 domain-containing protein [Trinickia dinghuensis]RDU98198.1 DUF4148 domain-containing protein [Trinickia dinghuensis]